MDARIHKTLNLPGQTPCLSNLCSLRSLRGSRSLSSLRGFSMVEVLIALAVSSTMIAAMSVAAPLAHRQLSALYGRMAAEVFLRNMAEYIRTNPLGDYRYNHPSTTSARECMRSSCDPDALARFELHRASTYLQETMPQARFDIERRAHVYRLSVHPPGFEVPLRLEVIP